MSVVVVRSLGQAQSKGQIIEEAITHALNLYRLELYPTSPWNIGAVNFDKLVTKALEYASDVASAYEYPVSSAEIAAALVTRGYTLTGELPIKYQVPKVPIPTPDPIILPTPEPIALPKPDPIILPRVPIRHEDIYRDIQPSPRPLPEPIVAPPLPRVDQQPPVSPYDTLEAEQAPTAANLTPSWLWIAGLVALVAVARNERGRSAF